LLNNLSHLAAKPFGPSRFESVKLGQFYNQQNQNPAFFFGITKILVFALLCTSKIFRSIPPLSTGDRNFSPVLRFQKSEQEWAK